MKPGDKEFLDVFYTKLKENTSRTRGGSKAEDFRKKHKIEWSYHDWSSGDVRVSVPQEKEGKGIKKRKLDEGGDGNSGNKRNV